MFVRRRTEPQKSNMVYRLCEFNSVKYIQSLALRDSVLRKPLGLDFDPKTLGEESSYFTLVAFENDVVVGTCQWFVHREKTIKVRQVAVSDNCRGQGIGRKMNDFIENWCKSSDIERIELHARKVAFGFYEKLGFKSVGEVFQEVGIPHKLMIKEI